MVNKTVECYHGGSEQLVKNGKAPNGKQKYPCRACGKASRENPDFGYSEAHKEEVIKAYQERSSMRGIARTFGMSRNTLMKWLKKTKMLPALEATLVKPKNPATVCLELDEMWSFVRQKVRKRWVWLALCKSTRQVVACVVGGRGIATCRQLWKAAPNAFKQGVCFTDFWEAYKAVIPDEHHQAVGKASGLTAHVERLNNTIRQRTADRPGRLELRTLAVCRFVQDNA